MSYEFSRAALYIYCNMCRVLQAYCQKCVNMSHPLHPTVSNMVTQNVTWNNIQHSRLSTGPVHTTLLCQIPLLSDQLNTCCMQDAFVALSAILLHCHSRLICSAD